MAQKLKIVVLFVVFSIPALLASQNLKERKFEKTVYDVIRFYDAKDSDKINKLINKAIGCYILSTPGAQVYWQNVKKLPLNENDTIFLPIPINEKLVKQRLFTHYKLRYEAYPKINCEYPSKKGLFVDSTMINREVSTDIKNLTNAFDDETKKRYMIDYNKIYNLETNTRKVILVSDKSDNEGIDNVSWGDTFIFYLTYIKSNWYLTIIDHTDCFLTE